MKEGGTGLHKTVREMNLVYKGLNERVIGVISIAINPSIMSDDHPASCLSTSLLISISVG